MPLQFLSHWTREDTEAQRDEISMHTQRWWLTCIGHLLCAREMTASKCQYREAPFFCCCCCCCFFFYPFHSLENHGKEKLRNVLEAHRQVQLGLEAKPALQQMASPPGRVSSKQRGPRESRPCPQGARSLVGEARKTTVGCRDF